MVVSAGLDDKGPEDTSSPEDTSLLRGASIEDLVQSPHSLPLGAEGVPVSLAVCLEGLFEQGWRPTTDGMGLPRLAEETILWLKSLARFQASTLQPQEPPPVVEQLLASFNKMVGSTAALQQGRKVCEKKLAAARSAVESRAQAAALSAEGQSGSQEALGKRREMLQAWLSKTEEAVRIQREELESYHSHVRTLFEDRIQEVVNLAYDEYRKANAPPVASDVEIDAEEFNRDLDAALEGIMLTADESGEAEAAVESQTATKVFEQLQGAVVATLEGTDVPQGLKEKVVSSMHGMFLDAFTTPVPPAPPSLVQPGGLGLEGQDVLDQAMWPDNQLGLETPVQEATQPDMSEPSKDPPQPDVPDVSEPVAGDRTKQVSQKRLIVPAGCDRLIVQKKVNIFNPEVCKKIGWAEGLDCPKAPNSSVQQPSPGQPAEGEVHQQRGSDNPSPPIPEVQQAAAANSMPPPAVPPRVAALSREFARKDTSDLEKEDLEKDRVDIDGKVLYKNAKTGKLETLEERQARLQHNRYMRFSRSIAGRVQLSVKTVCARRTPTSRG